MRSLALPFALVAAVFALGNALAAGDYLTAAAAGALVIVGILLLAPGASAHPSPATATEDSALATGVGK